MAWLTAEDTDPKLKRTRMDTQWALSFSNEDKIGIIQPHDNTLVVTLRIGGV